MFYKVIISKVEHTEFTNYMNAEIGWGALEEMTLVHPTISGDPIEFHITLESIFLTKKISAKFKTTYKKLVKGKGA